MTFQIVNPDTLQPPRGWNHGMLSAPGGRVLFVAGQTAAGPSGRVPDAQPFTEQFGAALENILAVVQAAGGGPEHIGRFTIYVTDVTTYRESLKPLGAIYRRHMGAHFPAMALVEVRCLVDPNALVEIEATAVL